MIPVRPVTNVLMTCAIDTGVGGVQVVFRDLHHWFQESGRHVHLVYPAPLSSLNLVEKIDAWGHPAFYCPMPGIVRDSMVLSVAAFFGYLPITFFHIARLIRAKKIDVVNCHYLSPYFIHLVIAAHLLRVPIVVSVHGADVDSYAESGNAYRLACRLIVHGVDRIVGCSKALAKRTMEMFPAAQGKVTYVHNGLDLSHYAEPRTVAQFPRPYVLCTARHVRKKGVDTLLRAFAVVLRQVPDIWLMLVGDGPLLEEHKALAAGLNIQQKVVFAGAVPHQDVPSLVEGCTLFVLPSRAEPFGLVLLEAALFKKPIVCTRVGGIPEIIEDRVNGLMVEPDDAEDMAAQILVLLREPTRAVELGRQAYLTLTSRFLWKQRILDYIAIYEGSAGPSPQVAPNDALPPSFRGAPDVASKTG